MEKLESFQRTYICFYLVLFLLRFRSCLSFIQNRAEHSDRNETFWRPEGEFFRLWNKLPSSEHIQKKSQNANWLDILLLLLLSRPDLSVMLSERIAMAYVIGSERTSITFYRNIFHVFPVVPFSHFPSCALQCHSQWNSTLHHRTSINSEYTALIDFYDCRTSNRYKMASMNGEYSPGRPVIPSGAREPGEPTAFRTSCKNFFKIKRYFKLFRKCYFISSFSFMPISFTKCYVFRKHKNLCLVFVVAAFFYHIFFVIKLLFFFLFISKPFQLRRIHSFVRWRRRRRRLNAQPRFCINQYCICTATHTPVPPRRQENFPLQPSTTHFPCSIQMNVNFNYRYEEWMETLKWN